MTNTIQVTMNKKSLMSDLTSLKTLMVKHPPTKVDAIIQNVQFQKPTMAKFPVDHQARSILESKPKWLDDDYRQTYMESSLHQTIAWQVRINRKARGLSIEKMAELAAISLAEAVNIEDTENEEHDLNSLTRIAHVFGCALITRFASYSELAYHSNRLQTDHLYACGFKDEINDQNNAVKLNEK